MSSRNIQVGVEVNANVKGEQSIADLGHSLESTGSSAKKLGADATGAAGGVGSADSAAKGFTATSGKLSDGLESVSVQLAKAKTELLQLLGIGAGVQGVKDISALADSYKNLEARIKLTTGEGKAFDTAFTGVFEVAKRTSSAVEETGLLFTKLAEAGKTLGMSQSEALKLTETINQSIQISGASAEASKASIVQLVQGLQSGVLRGDEFNSVMEQSPRLAKALGDGLGVTTGELRKMAEEGKLTSATIVKALQGQSDAVASEFGKLPATVGRAMTNLTTSFTAYVGEADKAGGYTSKLATVIDALAGNLGTVANAMIHTGQTLGAMKLLSMAQDWLAASAAIQASSVATEAATASTIRSTSAKVQNTTATVANTAAQTANAAAWGDIASKLGGVGPRIGAAGVEAAGAASKFGLLSGAAGSLVRAFAPLAALDIVLNFKSYGTAIGEWAARMMGAKDRSAELAAADKRATEEANANAAARKKQAAELKEAADRSFGLSKEAGALITKFDEMRTKGDSASEAISKIGKDFDLSNIQGIKDAAGVLDKLAADGKLSAGEFQKAWAEALKGQDLAVFEANFKASMLQTQKDAEKAGKALEAAIASGLSGKELKVFEEKAREALAVTTREAERFKQVVGAELQEAVRRTGLDMDVISGGMGKASRSAINDTEAMIHGLDNLKAMGVDTAQALTASLGKGINTSDSQKAIEAVKAQIEAVRKVLGDKVADGLLDQAKQKSLDLKDELDKAKPGINSLREAMELLGLKSSESLNKTAKTAQEAYDFIKAKGQEEGESYVTWQARKDAAARVMLERLIAANGGVITEAIKARAAMEGIDLSSEKAGRSMKGAFDSGSDAASRFTQNAGASLEEIKRMDAALDAINGKYGQSKAHLNGTYKLDEQTKAKPGQIDLSLATKLLDATNSGRPVDMTASEYAQAKEQAKIAYDAVQTGGQNATGLTSLEALRSTEALYRASMNRNAVNITDKPAGPAAPAAPVSARTVNINLSINNSQKGTVDTSPEGATVMQNFMNALQQSKLSSGM